MDLVEGLENLRGMLLKVSLFAMKNRPLRGRAPRPLGACGGVR